MGYKIMIAYKVVEKNTRHGSNWAIYRNFCKSRPHLDSKIRKKYPQYFPRYLKGTTVKAATGSVGIMCFEDKTDAQRFLIRELDYGNIYGKIIKVKGYNKNKVTFWIGCHCASSPENIIENKFAEGTMRPPLGTIAFKSVKVLE